MPMTASTRAAIALPLAIVLSVIPIAVTVQIDSFDSESVIIVDNDKIKSETTATEEKFEEIRSVLE